MITLKGVGPLAGDWQDLASDVFVPLDERGFFELRLHPNGGPHLPADHKGTGGLLHFSAEAAGLSA